MQINGMLGFVMFGNIIYTYFFMKAKNCLRRQDILCAVQNFLKAEQYKMDDYQLYIYKGLSQFILKEFEASLHSFKKALSLIEQNNKLSNDEKIYLKKYVFDHILDIYRILGKNDHFNKLKIEYDQLSYNGNNINKNFFYDFPMDMG